MTTPTPIPPVTLLNDLLAALEDLLTHHEMYCTLEYGKSFNCFNAEAKARAMIAKVKEQP